MSAFIKARAYTARKRYICALCGLSIEVGERYNYVVCSDDGRFKIAHEHLDCAHRYECPNLVAYRAAQAAGR